jgi:hypothetical protein
VNITQVKPSANGAEIFIPFFNTGDLPVTQYILKYDLQDTKDSELQTLIIPGTSLILKRSFYFFFVSAQISSEQIIKIENLRPSTNYRFLIVAESRAGIGQQTGPIQFRTLERQIPDFSIDENKNGTCVNDETCLITWNIESDGGAPIVRAEIFYARVKKSLHVKSKFSFFF